jgi:hypothetical protein
MKTYTHSDVVKIIQGVTQEILRKLHEEQASPPVETKPKEKAYQLVGTRIAPPIKNNNVNLACPVCDAEMVPSKFVDKKTGTFKPFCVACWQAQKDASE